MTDEPEYIIEISNRHGEIWYWVVSREFRAKHNLDSQLAGWMPLAKEWCDTHLSERPMIMWITRDEVKLKFVTASDMLAFKMKWM